jgi:hypothetical protein
MCRDVLGVCLRFAVPGRYPVAPIATRGNLASPRLRMFLRSGRYSRCRVVLAYSRQSVGQGSSKGYRHVRPRASAFSTAAERKKLPCVT